MEAEQARRNSQPPRKIADTSQHAVVLRPNELLFTSLQRSIGNLAVGQFLTSKSAAKTIGPTVLQRACDCGGACAECLAQRPVDVPEETTTDAASLRRLPAETLQRDADAGDVTGTNLVALDSQLLAKLKDRAVFDWGGKATLKEALNAKSNASVAIMSRIGAMISATAPWLWGYVAKIDGGGWITDNFGMGFTWTNGAALSAALAADGGFCEDNPITAQHYHGTTGAFRQIGSRAGTATMHIITSGRTEVHIDVHQPVEGKEANGRCNYDLSAWMGHATDVAGGGDSGATGTALGRYAGVYGSVDNAKKDMFYRPATDDKDLLLAVETLKPISITVQRYAAMGKMIGNEWEGDQALLQDTQSMAVLVRAEEMVRRVRSDQHQRRPSSRGPKL
jgi:hypothetical protein